MRICITGGAGFIGANLVERLLCDGHDLVLIDNLSTGSMRFLKDIDLRRMVFLEADLSQSDAQELSNMLKGVDLVFHLAANADVRGGWASTAIDIRNNVVATHNLALASRIAGVKDFVFASTGCVYGDSTVIPTPEDEPFPIQTSFYGASKVAAEGILSTYAAHGAFNVSIFRFVSVLGKYYHHGHVVDFVRQLKQDPKKLKVLGDGTQKKSYVHVDDCVEALVTLRGKNNLEVFNIGQSYYWDIGKSVDVICASLGVSPIVTYGNSDRGWVGDNPFTFLDTTKALSHGWLPQVSIEASVSQCVEWVKENLWVLELDKTRPSSTQIQSLN